MELPLAIAIDAALAVVACVNRDEPNE